MDTLIKSVDGREEGYVIKTKNNSYFSTNELLDWCFESDINRADIYDSIEDCKVILENNNVDLDGISFKRIVVEHKIREYEE